MSGSVPSGLFSAAADLGSPDLKRLIVRLALPAVVGLSANAVHHLVNALFVGRIGVEAMAAVTVAAPILILVAAVGEGIGVGTAAAVGRLLGAGRKPRAGATASSAIALTLILGPLLGLVLLLARGPLLQAFGATPDTLHLAESYLVVFGFGATLSLLQIVCDFIAISEGNTRFSMWTLIGGFGLNLVLDAVLIFWLGLGVPGAALATVLSQAAVVAVYAWYFRRRLGVVLVAPARVRLTRRVLGPVLAIGWPTAAASALAGAVFAFLYRSAASTGGEGAIAAVGIALRVMTFGTLPVLGFALGAQAVLGYAFGASDRDRVMAAAGFMATVTTGFAALYALVVIAFAGPIAGLFTPDPLVRELGARALVAAHLAFPFLGLRSVVLVLLQAMGRSRQAAILGLAANGYLLVPLLVLLPPRYGLDGVLASLTGSALLTMLLAFVLAMLLRREFQRPADLPAGRPLAT